MGAMMNLDGSGMQGPPPARRIGFDLRLRSLSASRSAFARLLRSWARGELPTDDFKVAVYGMSAYLNFLKTEREDLLELRLCALEEQAKKEAMR